MFYPLYAYQKVLARHSSHLLAVTSPLSALPKSLRSTTRFPNLPVLTPRYSVRPVFFSPTKPCAHYINYAKKHVTAISTDSEYSHHAWAQQERSAGGLGPNLCIPLLADRNMRVAREYGCLIEDKGIAFRASYLIDPKGILRYGPLSPSTRVFTLQ